MQRLSEMQKSNGSPTGPAPRSRCRAGRVKGLDHRISVRRPGTCGRAHRPAQTNRQTRRNLSRHNGPVCDHRLDEWRNHRVPRRLPVQRLACGEANDARASHQKSRMPHFHSFPIIRCLGSVTAFIWKRLGSIISEIYPDALETRI